MYTALSVYVCVCVCVLVHARMFLNMIREGICVPESLSEVHAHEYVCI